MCSDDVVVANGGHLLTCTNNICPKCCKNNGKCIFIVVKY